MATGWAAYSGCDGAECDLALDDAGGIRSARFDVVLTNAEGSVTSPEAILTVLNEPVVAWQAVAQTGAGEWAPSKWNESDLSVT